MGMRWNSYQGDESPGREEPMMWSAADAKRRTPLAAMVVVGAMVVGTAYGLGASGVPGQAFVAALDWCVQNQWIPIDHPHAEMVVQIALS